MNRLLLVVVVGVLALLPQLDMVPEFWITQLNYIGLSSLVVLGLVLLTGVGGLTSFGQAAFVGVGAYTTAWLTTHMGVSPWFTLFIALAITFLFASVLGAITLRLSGHYLPLGTIAWSLSLYYLFGNLEFLGQHDGISGIKPLTFFGISLGAGRNIYYLVWLFLLVGLWLTYNLLHSRPGRAIRALKHGSSMAESFGVNMASYKVIIFVYAALLACVSGWSKAVHQSAGSLARCQGSPLIRVLSVGLFCAASGMLFSVGDASGEQVAQGFAGFGFAHECFADQEGVDVIAAHQLDVFGCQDTAFSDDQFPLGDVWKQV